MKPPLKDLNPESYPPHLTNIYICGLTIAPIMRCDFIYNFLNSKVYVIVEPSIILSNFSLACLDLHLDNNLGNYIKGSINNSQLFNFINSIFKLMKLFQF